MRQDPGYQKHVQCVTYLRSMIETNLAITNSSCQPYTHSQKINCLGENSPKTPHLTTVSFTISPSSSPCLQLSSPHFLAWGCQETLSLHDTSNLPLCIRMTSKRTSVLIGNLRLTQHYALKNFCCTLHCLQINNQPQISIKPEENEKVLESVDLDTCVNGSNFNLWQSSFLLVWMSQPWLDNRIIEMFSNWSFRILSGK